MAKQILKVHERRSHDVIVQLFHTESVPGKVYWSQRGNSYVLAEGEPPCGDEEGYGVWRVDGKWARLYSVNGAGEVRWDVRATNIRDAERHEEEGTLKPEWDIAEFLEAARFFRLVP